LADPNAALVTAIDIGERTDIHPANKVILGQRLALGAQGIALPMPVSARVENAYYRLTFSGVEGSLMTWSGTFPLALELCGEVQETCRFAVAKADGSSLLIPDDGGELATRIRYGWADSPVVNTYDARAMPLPGFEIAVED
jgi:sialate O-acetylesterase